MAEINIYRLLDGERQQMIPYTTSTSLAWFKPFMVSTKSFVPDVATPLFCMVWENPENVPILVHMCAILIGTAATAASTLDLGTTVDAITQSDNMLNGFNLQNAPGWYNTYTDLLGAEVPIQYMDERGGTTAFITGQVATGTDTALVATLYVFYTTLDF